MAKTDDKKGGATGAATATTEAAETKKVRRLNMATEEYVVGTDKDAKDKTLKGFSNLYPARNEAKAQIKAGAKSPVKIWVRELESKKLVEHVDTYEPKAEAPATATTDAGKGKGKKSTGTTDAGTATAASAQPAEAPAAETNPSPVASPIAETTVEPAEEAA